jgi:hypothetical protein
MLFWFYQNAAHAEQMIAIITAAIKITDVQAIAIFIFISSLLCVLFCLMATLLQLDINKNMVNYGTRR